MSPNFVFCPERLRLREAVVDATTAFAAQTLDLISSMGRLPRDIYLARLEQVDRARQTITNARAALSDHESAHCCHIR